MSVLLRHRGAMHAITTTLWRRTVRVNALEKLQLPFYLVSPEEHEKSNKLPSLPARLGNMGNCDAIIDL